MRCVFHELRAKIDKKSIMAWCMHVDECSSLHSCIKHPEKAKPLVKVGQKTTDLMKNHKIAGLPKGK